MLLILIERQDSNAMSLRTSETFQLPTKTHIGGTVLITINGFRGP